MADGGMRDAQSIFDQMISFCGSEISEADVLDVYGLVAADKIAELAGALAAGDHKKIIAIVDDCDENGRDLFRLLLICRAAFAPPPGFGREGRSEHFPGRKRR